MITSINNKYLWMFKNESGDDAYPLFWADIPVPNDINNNPKAPLRNKVIYWIGDDYYKPNDCICGQVFHFQGLEYLNNESILSKLP